MRKKRPIKIITLDTETYNGLIGDLKRIAIYDGEKITYGYTFEDIEGVLLDYENAGFDTHVYIHNLEFDARKIPCVFSEDRIVWEKCFIINGKIATISTKYYTIHDSFKLLPMSLKKLCKGFNVKHGKLDLWEEVQKLYSNEYKDIVDFLDRCDKDNELYLRYLGYDVMGLYEVLQELMKIARIEESDFVKRISTASLSRFLFKNGYDGEDFITVGNHKTDYQILTQYNWTKHQDIEDFIRDSYCGGRTEVFKPRLTKKGYHYDVNSLYPSVMDLPYPVGKPIFYSDCSLAEHYFTTWLKNHEGLGFISCSVFIPEQNIPPLPVKMGKLTFPCGHVYGVFTYEELEYAIKECGCKITEYREVCHFVNTFPVFKNFVSTFYKLKEKGTETNNEPLRTLAKLILNVAYGYTGMRRDDKTTLRPFKDYSKYKEIIFADKEIGFIEVPTDIKAEYIQVQVASYVTSRARLVLLKALRNADKNGTVYYCDTDSIVTDKPLDKSLVSETELGKWKLEGEPIRAIFLRPKVYAEAFENEVNVKFKGVSRETQETLNFDSYEHLYTELEEMKKDYEIIEKNRTTLRSIMYMQKNNISPDYYEKRDKKINFKTVEKRLMNYKENYTKPHVFNSEEQFENFNYNSMKKSVQFDMTKGGHE